MAQKTPALGKGLASLLPPAQAKSPLPVPPSSGQPSVEFSPEEVAREVDATQSVGATAAGPALPIIPPDDGNRDRHPGISLVNLEDIKVNPFQPRREFDTDAIDHLAQSIQANGLIQPIIVRKNAEGYELIAGERRLRACRKLGLKQVPIVIKRVTDKESLEMALIENIQREDLNCIETALAYYQLIEEFSLTQEDVARRVGKDRASVSNHLRLLRLPEEVIEDLKKGEITLGHGKALLSLESQESQTRAWKQIKERGLSVRDSESLADQWKRLAELNHSGDAPAVADEQETQAAALRSRFKHLSKELASRWSTKVDVKGNEHRGKIVLHYRSREDLERILTKMQNGN